MGNSFTSSSGSGSGGGNAETNSCRAQCAAEEKDYTKLMDCYNWCQATATRRKRSMTDELSGKDIQLLVEETKAEIRAESGSQRKYEDVGFIEHGVTKQLAPVIPALIN